MHVVAVSVARPQWIDVRGRNTLTAIVRQPSAQPVYFGPAGPVGNETAVHTEHVYAFIAEHYDTWTRELGIARSGWEWCHWGENLTLHGVLESDLHIGDRLRVGGAVLMVTSPRIPCYKLAWRIGQPDSFLRTLIQSGRMGLYLQVLEPGFIGAGDRVEVIARAEDTICVADLGRLLFDDSITDTQRLARLLGIEGLGSQATGMIRKRIGHLRDGGHVRRGRWNGWRSFRIDELTEEAADIRSLRISPVDGGEIAGYRAGQFLTLRLPAVGGEAPVRVWSISKYDVMGSSYRVSVKRGAGAGSAWIHEHARSGALVDVRPPAGAFTLDRSGILRVVMISAGVGVAPMVSMLEAHAELGADAPPLLWLHSTTCGRTHAFRDEVSALLARLPNGERRVHYTRPDAGDVQGAHYDAAGRVTPELIEMLIRSRYTFRPFGRSIELGGDNSVFYLCGPEDFMAMVRTTLMQAGVPEAAIRQEAFAPVHADARMDRLPEVAVVSFKRSNAEIHWHRDEGMTLLELAEHAGLRPEYGCRMGACGTCEAGLLKGSVQYDERVPARPEEGRVLLCCSRPLTADIAIDL